MKLPGVRSLLKAEKHIVLYAALAGLLVWFVDAGLDWMVFYRDQGTFWQLLITRAPSHELYIRTLILAVFIVFGLITRSYILKIRSAASFLQQSEQKLYTTLNSIGDGVIAADTLEEARGQNLTTVFKTINEYTRAPMESPVDKVLASGHVVGLANSTVLVSKKGPEYIIADSGSPIRTPKGEITGVVLVFRDDTARRRAEDEIHHFQARYESLYQASRDGYAMVDLGGAILESNKAFRALIGYSDEEIKTLDFQSITPEKWHAMEQDILDTQVMARGYSDVYEKEYVRKDGCLVPVEIQTYLYRDRRGRAAGRWVYVRDISERKAADDAQQQFRNIVRNTPLGIHMWDLQPGGALVFKGANPASDKMLGISCEDRIGKPVELAFPGLAGTDIPDQYRRVATTGTPWFFEQVEYDDQQISGAFEVYAFQVKPGSMAAMFLEITERKRTEAALADNEARYRSMFENTGSGVAVYRAVDAGADFMIVEFNRAAERIEAVRREDIIGRSVLDVFPGVREFGIFDVFQRVWRTGEPASFPLGLYEDNRIQGWRDNYIYKLPSGEIVAVYDDVTARKQAEQALAHYRDHLEDLVEERTRELRNTQQELIQAERLAALGQFSGNVSHEIRNPLGVIATSAYYLKRRLEGTDPKVDKHLKQISAQVNNCSRIIKSILDLTRMEAPRKQPVNLAACIRAGITSAGPCPQNVVLELDLLSDPLMVSADPEQLRMAFKNLVMNAFQSMAQAGGVLSVTALHDGAGAQALARIRIADTGPGIPGDIRDKIFQPLFTTRAKGIGFGLSITQMIIERHDGTITLDPDPGAAFVITLPISQEENSVNG